MKLIFKIYSPFLFILAVLFSCTQKNSSGSYSPLQTSNTIKQLEKQQQLAEEYYKNKNYDAALTHYTKLKGKWAEVKRFDKAGYVTLQLAWMVYNSGNYYESENLYVEALKYIKLTNNKENLVTVYNTLGMIYRKLYDYDSALKNYNQVFPYIKDSAGICALKNNIANVYKESRQYKKALNMFLKLNQTTCGTINLETQARILDNIGEIYTKTNNPKAIQFLQEGLNIRQSNKDKYNNNNDNKGLKSSYFNLYDYYKEKDSNKAKNYVLLAYNIAKAEKNGEDQLLALKALQYISNGEEAAAYGRQYTLINDSLNIKKLRTSNKFVKIIYDYKDEQSRRLEAELEARQKELITWMLVGLALLITVIFIFIYKTQRLKHKKDKILEVYNTESRISKKIHDELANDVFRVMTFAESNEIQYRGQHKLLRDLDAIYNKTRDISHENNTIDTGEKFGEILRQMLADYKTESVNVIFSNFDTIKWNLIEAHKKIAVYRVLHELMVNMKKHSGANMVVLKFSAENNKASIQYSDNGKGFKNNQILKNGLQNAENRILAIGGSLIFGSSTGGLKVNLTFPV